MPGNGRRCVLKNLSNGVVICASVDEMNLWVSFGMPGGRMDVESSKILAKFQRLFDWEICEILVLENLFHFIEPV